VSAPDILARLSAVGLRLSRECDSLIAAPRSALTDELRALLRAHKAELLAALTDPGKPNPASALGRPQEPAGKPEADHDSSPTAGNADALERAYAFLKGRALAKLEAGTADLAVIADDELAPGTVLVAVARRNKFVCVLAIDPAKYDGVRLLELVERHTVH